MFKKKRITILLLIVAVILLIPFVAMQLTKEASWSIFDFVIAAILLLSFGFGFLFVMNKVKNRPNRLALIIVLFILFALIRGEVAVGIFGTSFAGN